MLVALVVQPDRDEHALGKASQFLINDGDIAFDESQVLQVPSVARARGLRSVYAQRQLGVGESTMGLQYGQNASLQRRKSNASGCVGQTVAPITLDSVYHRNGGVASDSAIRRAIELGRICLFGAKCGCLADLPIRFVRALPGLEIRPSWTSHRGPNAIALRTGDPRNLTDPKGCLGVLRAGGLHARPPAQQWSTSGTCCS